MTTQETVPRDPNIIDSRFVLKVKVEEGGKKSLKAGLYLHGNRDRIKGLFRYDAVGARFEVIRTMLSIATILGFIIRCLDIKGTFSQSGPINRELYIRPPRDLGLGQSINSMTVKKITIWNRRSGRQWAKNLERWMIMEPGLEKVNGISEMFLKQGKDGNITLIFAKNFR